jgi:hypothetical protein
MIPQPYRDNFTTLLEAVSNGDACLMECHEQQTGQPAYVIFAVSRIGPDYEFIPFARLFDANPYDLLLPPGRSANAGDGKEPRP